LPLFKVQYRFDRIPVISAVDRQWHQYGHVGRLNVISMLGANRYYDTIIYKGDEERNMPMDSLKTNDFVYVQIELNQ